MPLFQPSQKTIQVVRQEIADSAGASADTEMVTRAGRSLDAAIEHFNNRAKWDFLWTEHSPIRIFAPFAVTGVSASAGQVSAAAPAGHGILVDDFIQGLGILLGTRVSATGTTSFGMNTAFTTTLPAGVQVIDIVSNRDMYDLPSAWKSPYSARTLANLASLRFLRRRFYDRSVTDEFVPSTPLYYGIERTPERGKLRLMPPPIAPDVLQLRYYRRITVSTATGDALDFPQDYEPYLIAWGKWHFLTDKADDQSGRASTWLALANDGIKTMLADQTNQTDEDLMFLPGHMAYNPAYGPNSVRRELDE